MAVANCQVSVPLASVIPAVHKAVVCGILSRHEAPFQHAAESGRYSLYPSVLRIPRLPCNLDPFPLLSFLKPFYDLLGHPNQTVVVKHIPIDRF